jgi:hypothetical protein
MTQEEIKLVVSLARDSNYHLPDWVNALATRQWLLTASKMDVIDTTYDTEGVHDSDRVYLFIEDLAAFFREYCLYDDLSPNHGPMTQWLRLLSTPAVELADITPESWSKLLTSKVIQRMNK